MGTDEFDELRILKETFFAEAQEVFESLDNLLVKLENEPSNFETLNAVFRHFHTLKGSGGIFGIKVLEDITHQLEDLLDYLRSNNIEPSPVIMDILFEGLDILKEVIANYAKGEDTDALTGKYLVKKIKEVLSSKEVKIEKKEADAAGNSLKNLLMELLNDENEKVAIAIKENKNLHYVVIHIDEDCFTKGVDPLSLLKTLDSHGDIVKSKSNIENLPLLKDLDPSKLYIKNIEILYTSNLGSGELNELVKFSDGTLRVEVRQISMEEILKNQQAELFWDASKEEEKTSSPKVPSGKIGDILIEMGEVTEDQLRKALEKQSQPIGRILVAEGATSEEKVEEALLKQKKMGLSSKIPIKVDIDKLDHLVNLVGELVVSQTMVCHNKAMMQFADNDLLKTLSQLSKVTRDIQELVMNIRMLPVKGIFQRMTRVARDVGRKVGKEVEVCIYGEETELDKTMIDEIGDPLLHIIRNAVDHGIENNEERLKNGKYPRGIIELSAYHQGGNIIIEISDDGKGLNRDKILDTALENGLIDGTTVLDDNQIDHLIFEPGFSTADEITGVSGRGVGMDVVKKNIERLKGKVDIRSTPGEGTTFFIRLPLTLAVIDGMVVKVGHERYVIPTVSIIESIKPEKEHLFTVKEKGEMIKIRDELFPVTRLNRLFNVESSSKCPWDGLVILVEGEGRRGCILVDELLGQQQVVIKSLGKGFRGLRGISGGGILGDGKVGLILDTAGILDLSIQ
ncbi:MAG: chemotaxis protein CheW [Proteobacteria bacterium]|nr:chemotaxis protein CheW [Pseudomonadota bacterium]